MSKKVKIFLHRRANLGIAGLPPPKKGDLRDRIVQRISVDGRILLTPGLNELSQEDWQACLASSYVQAHLKNPSETKGKPVIEVLECDAGPDPKPEPEKQPEPKPVEDTQDESQMSASETVEIILESTDIAFINDTLINDFRKTVQSACQKRLKQLEG